MSPGGVAGLDMLRVGEKVPDFTLQMATAEGRRPFRLSEALGQGDIFLVFYPLAFTGVCTRQVCETRDALHFFEHVHARPYGFSTDTPQANAAYAREQKLGFPLLSDPNREVVERIWETQDESGVARVAKRGWMVVGPDGVVKALWKTDDAEVWPGLAEAKKVLHAGHHH